MLKHIYSGKVRDIYEIDEERLLFVTSDRMSAFDVVMAEPIPSKGRVLVALTAYWTAQLSEVAPTHLISVGAPENLDLGSVGISPEFAQGRSMVVRRAEMLPIECIVRGYLSGSAWAEYKRSGTMHGQPPVSYTHLDVYKRQSYGVPTRTVNSLAKSDRFRLMHAGPFLVVALAVSYTHLDVYKRQALPEPPASARGSPQRR